MNIPTTVSNKYIYGLNNPALYRDPTGRDIFEDLWNSIGTIVVAVIAIVIAVLDVALGAIMHSISPNQYGLPNLRFEKDGWTVENSFLGTRNSSFSFGPMIGLERGEEYGGTVWKHEYGHRLQYQDWGGWEYAQFAIERISGIHVYSGPDRTDPREYDADIRATEHFGVNICVYGNYRGVRNRYHPLPQCR